MREKKNKIVIGVNCMESFHQKPAECDYIVDVQDCEVSTLQRKVAELGFEIDKVMIGCESGVIFYEKVCHEMHLWYRNDIEKVDAHRNKYNMHMILKDHGVPIPRQLETNDLAEIENFIEREISFPCVLKPIDSSGTVGVHVCKCMEDVERAHFELLHTDNVFGYRSEFILVQEQLKGTEYVVDCVSKNGQHQFVDFWEYNKTKTPEGVVERQSINRNLDEPLQQECYRQTCQVLDALGIRNGASHSEMIVTSEGPRLLETGARMHGGMFPGLCALSKRHSQIDLLQDMQYEEGVFEQVQGKYTNNLLKFSMGVSLISNVEGKLKKDLDMSTIEKLPSQVESFVKHKGDEIHKTIDFVTSPGTIHLVHESWEQVLKDEEAIREMERNPEFYELE